MITRAVCRTLIGREAELTRLEDALLGACRGEGGVVVLAGEAGMGKSRLATELAHRAKTLGAAVMQGSCSEADLALPYLPFLEAIGNYLQTADLGSLAERLGAARRDLGHHFPQLALETHADRADESSEAKLRLFEAILALLRIAAADSGLLLIVEDMHWADASTRELVDYITRRLRSSRILVLATYRKDELHRKHPLLPTVQGWQRSRLAEMIELEALPPDGVGRMVSAIFDTSVGEEFRDFMHRRCEGNPFVLEEMLKAAMDEGDIFRDQDEWQRKPIEQFGIPETVRDTILLRLDRMGPENIEILRAAAVLGNTFDYSLLSQLCERSDMEVEDALESLSEQQLVEEEAGAAKRYRFRHALTREAIYESLSAPRRERLHAKAAEVLQTRGGAPPAEIANHLFLSNQSQEALPLCLAAADAAQAVYAFREAAELRLRALPYAAPGEDRAMLVGQIGEAYIREGAVRLAHDYLEEAVDSLEALGRHVPAAHFRLYLGWSKSQGGRHDIGLLETRKARSILEPLGPSKDLTLVYLQLAADASVVSYRPEALALSEKLLAIAEAIDDTEAKLFAYVFIGQSFGNQGRVEEAVDWLEKSHSGAVAHGVNDVAGLALNNLADYLIGALRPKDASDRIALMRRLPQGGIWRDVRPLIEDSYLNWMVGDLKGALSTAREAIDAGRTLGNPRAEFDGTFYSANALIELGQYDEARRLVQLPNLGHGLQDAFSLAWGWFELQLAQGDASETMRGLEAIAPAAEQLRYAEGIVADQVVQAALLVGSVDLARRVVDAIEADQLVAELPLLLLPRARVARASGNHEKAREIAARAATQFAGAGYVPLECRARVLLSECLTDLGDRKAAEVELRSAFSSARGIGSVRMEATTRELLQQLGLEVEDAFTTPSRVEPVELGEKLVTLMFADVRGYTALAEGKAPTELIDRISTLHRWATQEVARQHGVVDKFAGDAVMATFNVSGKEIDHALHALKAALALRDKAAVLGLPLGIAIATGPAIIGQLSEGSNVSVVGETTNLASRLQAQAAAGEVLLSAEAHRRVKDWLRGQGIETPKDRLELKGLAEPVTAYRLKAHTVV